MLGIPLRAMSLDKLEFCHVDLAAGVIFITLINFADTKML